MNIKTSLSMHTGAPSLGATGDDIRLLTQLKCALVRRIPLNQDSDLSVRIGV
jgi:hypothetical protein